VPESVRVGVIGCGSFARTMHIPNMLANPKYEIRAFCDLDPAAAEGAQATAGAGYVTADADEVLADDSVDAVFITTRHDSHAALSVRAATAGKHILCEKPMGLDVRECRQVAEAVRKANVVYTVGYNRGIAPLVLKAKELLAADRAEKLVYHRIQAPFPVSHWIHDPQIGGGRLVGEGCHVFDLLCELMGAAPTSVYASGGTFLDPQRVATPDSGIVTLSFADGSVGAALIASEGCAAFPKEATEIYWAGKAIHIDNYRELSFHGVAEGDEVRMTLEAVDKGHRREIDLFADAILYGERPPNGLANAFRAALISFLAVESIASRESISVAESDYEL
jgi:predicted dehydrogenase